MAAVRESAADRRGIGSYLSTCAQSEHFLAYRKLVSKSISAQLEQHAAYFETAPRTLPIGSLVQVSLPVAVAARPVPAAKI